MHFILFVLIGLIAGALAGRVVRPAKEQAGQRPGVGLHLSAPVEYVLAV